MPKLSFSLPYDIADSTPSATGIARGSEEGLWWSLGCEDKEGPASAVCEEEVAPKSTVWLLLSSLSGDQPHRGDLGGLAPMSLFLKHFSALKGNSFDLSNAHI